jgi:hypothetical protein
MPGEMAVPFFLPRPKRPNHAGLMSVVVNWRFKFAPSGSLRLGILSAMEIFRQLRTANGIAIHRNSIKHLFSKKKIRFED